VGQRSSKPTQPLQDQIPFLHPAAAHCLGQLSQVFARAAQNVQPNGPFLLGPRRAAILPRFGKELIKLELLP
jgi:hypothetical protein